MQPNGYPVAHRASCASRDGKSCPRALKYMYYIVLDAIWACNDPYLTIALPATLWNSVVLASIRIILWTINEIWMTVRLRAIVLITNT